MKRIHTGVKNLDELLGGGIPEQTVLLIEGEPGSGKSSLGLEYLYRGALNNEPGLYVSFQEAENQILRTTTFDWQFEDMVNKGRINLVKFDPYRYEQVANMLRNSIMENKAKRIVLDPITDLDLYIDSRKDQRKNLLDIRDEIREMNASCLLLGEKEESTELEEEIADGIVKMNAERKENKMERQIYVKKLTGSDFDHTFRNYRITSDGIKIE